MFFAIGLIAALPITASAEESVDGYDRQDGTYVEPYVRTDPNDTPADNYSYPVLPLTIAVPVLILPIIAEPGSQPYSGSPPERAVRRTVRRFGGSRITVRTHPGVRTGI